MSDHPTLGDIACYPYVAVGHEGGVPYSDHSAVQAWIGRGERLSRVPRHAFGGAGASIRNGIMTTLFWLAGLYLLICAGGLLINRHFIYSPNPTRAAPAESGLEDVEEVVLEANDGTKLIAWYAAARDGKPTLLYFTGNGGFAGNRANKIATFMQDGYGVLLLNYRGFGGSGGRPTEAHNIKDALLAYAHLMRRGIVPEDIVLYGESLGTGVAVQVAAQRPAKAVVLEAPLTSVPDVGRQTWWFLPLRLIITDQYRSIDRIGAVHMPLLIVHGEQDRTIPASQAKALFAAANEPKKLVLFPEAGHNDLYDHEVWATIRAFVGDLSFTHLPPKSE